ncbi:MAG: hypothetical protein NTX42_05820 [Methanothrix sp.]|nr:hypothetical protein [Methanothrix sp.]
MLTLPTKIDWNNLNGKKWTTELRSQNPENKNVADEPKTCVAFGVLAVLEALLKIHYYNDPALALDLSEGSFWTCGHRWAAKGKPAGECSTWRDDVPVQTTDSWTLSTAMEYLKNFGVASGEDNPWPTICVCAASSHYTKIKNYQMISITGTKDSGAWTEEVKKHLVTNGPCIAEYSLPGYGKHCVAIVGYDDSLRKFLIKDSLDNVNPFISYDGGIPDIHSIEVYKPRLNIKIAGISAANTLYLKMVKTALTYPGNLTDVDPTVLPNLQSTYNASYDSTCGYITINKETKEVLPLHLAIPPGSYHIYVRIPDHDRPYFGVVTVGTPVSEIPVEITLHEQPATQDLSLSFDAVRKMITANWNAVAECASYRLIKAHIRVLDYRENRLLIEKHDLAVTCENGNVSSEISISEILPQYSDKLCKVEVRSDNLGQLSEWSEPLGIALVTPSAIIKRLENGINSIFIEIGFRDACGLEAQIYDGENLIYLDPSDIEIHEGLISRHMSLHCQKYPHCYTAGNWGLMDSNIKTFRPIVSSGRKKLKISSSRLIDGKCYNIKVRAKECNFIGPFAEQQITWHPASHDPTWFSDPTDIKI